VFAQALLNDRNELGCDFQVLAHVPKAARSVLQEDLLRAPHDRLDVGLPDVAIAAQKLIDF
jgi:hypothetical protein